MDGVAVMIVLQNQHTRPFVVSGVLFDNSTHGNAVQDIRDQDTIRRQLIVAVFRDQDLAPCDQVEDAEYNLTGQVA